MGKQYITTEFNVFGLLIAAMILVACTRRNFEFSTIPSLAFDNLAVKGGSIDNSILQFDSDPTHFVQYTFKFKDGDGNLGSTAVSIASGDTTSGLKRSNLFFLDVRKGYPDTTILQGGRKRIVQATSGYILPRFSTSKEPASIEGIFTIEIKPSNLKILSKNADSEMIQYKVWIKDQDNNVSDTVLTPPLLIRRN